MRHRLFGGRDKVEERRDQDGCGNNRHVKMERGGE